MRELIIAANWKMNTTPATAAELATRIAVATALPGVTRVICPPFVSLTALRDALSASDVAVGAQNVHAEERGAYTGEISAEMLVGLATWAIVGHSERRRDQGEDDALVARKLLRCAEHGLRPILCVGEQLAQREAGHAADTVRGQLRATVAELERHAAALPPGLVVAYEPVWAIGTGRTALASDAAEMAGVIRDALAESAGEAFAASTAVLYGGSVSAESIDEFMQQASIDGALVGGASLKVEEMSAIVESAARAAAQRMLEERA